MHSISIPFCDSPISTSSVILQAGLSLVGAGAAFVPKRRLFLPGCNVWPEGNGFSSRGHISDSELEIVEPPDLMGGVLLLVEDTVMRFYTYDKERGRVVTIWQL